MKIVLFLIALLEGSYLYGETYWVAFSGSDSGFEMSYYLMQIDEHGNIISGPAVIWQRQNASGQLTIAPRDSTTLNLWTCVIGHPKKHIYHLVIDKNTRKVVAESKTRLITRTYPELEVTQKRNNNFLTYPTAMQAVFKAVRLTDIGELTSEKWTLLRQYQPHRISPDGRMLLYFSYPDLFAQRLSRAGKLVGKAQNLGSSRPGDIRLSGIYDADVSNILPNKTRIVLYSVSRAFENDDHPDYLYSRLVNAADLKPVGNRVLLRKSQAVGEFTGVSIDPLGRFLLYLNYLGGSSLVYQSLDSKGYKAGRGKVLVRLAWIADLDLLKD